MASPSLPLNHVSCDNEEQFEMGARNVAERTQEDTTDRLVVKETQQEDQQRQKNWPHGRKPRSTARLQQEVKTQR
jgi:hypothetical protein